MSAKDLPVSRFPVPSLADMPTDIRERMEAVQEKSGFIPNVFLVLAHPPEETEAPGARRCGRPIHRMSRELALVAGSLCDWPGCAESADP